MAKQINVGLVGYQFMGKAHSHAYKDMAFFFPEAKGVPSMTALCGRNRVGVESAATQFGWQSTETSWKTLVKREDVDLVDICTPGDTHADIAIAAAENGKHVFCEKPLANNVADARAMLAAVKKAGVKHMVAYNYRRVPAVMLAKQIIDEGRLGDIYHWRATYLQDWNHRSLLSPRLAAAEEQSRLRTPRRSQRPYHRPGPLSPWRHERSRRR